MDDTGNPVIISYNIYNPWLLMTHLSIIDDMG